MAVNAGRGRRAACLAGTEQVVPARARVAGDKIVLIPIPVAPSVGGNHRTVGLPEQPCFGGRGTGERREQSEQHEWTHGGILWVKSPQGGHVATLCRQRNIGYAVVLSKRNVPSFRIPEGLRRRYNRTSVESPA